MAPQSRGGFGGRKKGGNHRASKEKRQFSGKKGRGPCKSKHANSPKPSSFSKSPKNRPAGQDLEEPLLKLLPPASVKTSTFKAKLSAVKALHKQWRDENQRSYLQSKKFVAYQRQ